PRPWRSRATTCSRRSSCGRSRSRSSRRAARPSSRAGSDHGRAHPRAPLAALIALAVIALVPAIFSSFTVGLVAQWLPLVVLALSLDLLWGENRIISFGHGAFFAGGGYVAGLLLRGPQ